MYVQKLCEKKTGRTLLCYYVCRRNPETRKNENTFVSRIGYVDELEKEYADPVAHFRAVAKERGGEAEKRKVVLELLRGKPKECCADGSDETKALSSAILCHVYHWLGIDGFVNNRRRYTKAGYNHNRIAQMLVYDRMLHSEEKHVSRLSAWDHRGEYIEGFGRERGGKADFGLKDIYRSLGFFASHRDALFAHLDGVLREKAGRSTEYMFYDVTNYYFEIDRKTKEEEAAQEDDKRKCGCSKEHRPNPIIQLGLFMDEGGYPVMYRTYDGNEVDSDTFYQSLADVRGLVRPGGSAPDAIYVADKGMMCGNNISALIMKRQGYIISYSVRGASADFQAYVLDESGYEDYETDKEGVVQTRIKERIQPRSVTVFPKSDKSAASDVVVNERQVVFWSRKYAEKARLDRARAVEKARGKAERSAKATCRGVRKNSSYGSDKYVAQQVVSLGTGEVAGAGTKSVRTIFTLDTGKVADDERLDGYYVICTNVIGLATDKKGNPIEEPFEGHHKWVDGNFFKLNKVVTMRFIMDRYRELWEIEESFRITKHFLSTRPVFVSVADHIEAHFLFCFLALLFTRVLQKQLLGGRFSIPQVFEALRGGKVGHVRDDYYTSLARPGQYPALDALGERLGIPFFDEIYSSADFRRIYGKMKETD
jgi:transposase